MQGLINELKKQGMVQQRQAEELSEKAATKIVNSTKEELQELGKLLEQLVAKEFPKPEKYPEFPDIPAIPKDFESQQLADLLTQLVSTVSGLKLEAPKVENNIDFDLEAITTGLVILGEVIEEQADKQLTQEELEEALNSSFQVLIGGGAKKAIPVRLSNGKDFYSAAPIVQSGGSGGVGGGRSKGYEGGPVVVGTSAIQMTFVRVTNSIQIEADIGNTGFIYVGKSSVTSAGANAITKLEPGATIIMDLNDADDAVYAVADAAGQTVYKLALV